MGLAAPLTLPAVLLVLVTALLARATWALACCRPGWGRHRPILAAQPAGAGLAATVSWLGMLAAGYAAKATLRLHAEETELRAEQVLATAAPRIRWAGSHLLVAAAGAAVGLATGGLVAGLAHGLRAGDLGGELPRVLAVP